MRRASLCVLLSLILIVGAVGHSADRLGDFITKLADEDAAQTFDSPAVPNPKSDYAKLPSRVYLDPDLDIATLTTKPDVDWEDCKTDPSLCIAWPDSTSTITRVAGVAPMEKQVLDLATNEPTTMSYVKVRVQYRRKGANGKIVDVDREGWIDARLLRKTELAPIYRAPPPPPKKKAVVPPPNEQQKDCPPGLEPSRNLDEILKLGQFLKMPPHEQLDATVEAIAPHIGNCPLAEPTKKRLDAWKGNLIYDIEVLGRLKNFQAKIPPLPKEKKTGVMDRAQFEDVIAIDALARTIYSEMNECFATGMEFPMAAAKVVVNRAKRVDAGTAPKTWTAGNHAKGKPAVAVVVTSLWQFSVWNHLGAKNPKDKTVLRSLCPTKDLRSANNWSGRLPNPLDVKAWQLATKIATEAVLFPLRFEERTKGVTQFYYTSKMNEYDGRERPNPPPRIAGRPVESFKCMYVWNGE